MNKLIFITVLSSGIYFSFNFTLAKMLGAEVYGEIQYYLSFMQIFLLSINLNYASLYMGSKILKENNDTFGLFVSLQSSFFLLMLLPAYFFLTLFIEDKVVILLVISLAYLLVLLGSASLEYNSINQTFNSIWIGSTVVRLLHIFFFGMTVWIGIKNTSYYFISYLASVFLVLIYVIIQFKPKLHIDLSIFSRAWKFYALGIIGGSFIYIAQIMQKEFYDYSQLAIVALSLLILSGIGMWSSLLIKIILPITHKYWKDRDSNGISFVYQNSSYLELIISIPLFLFILFNINNISNFLGEGYSQLPIVFYILSFGYFLEHITGITGTLLRVTENEHFELYNEIIKLSVGLGLIYNLRTYEHGIAVAISITTALYSLLKFLELYYLFKLWPLNKQFLMKLIVFTLVWILAFYSLSNISNLYIQLTAMLGGLSVGLYAIYFRSIKKSKLLATIL